MESRIRSLRDGLVQARRQRSLQLLDEVVRGVHDLAGEKYRYCLLDYNSFRTAYYVRVLGFENARIKAELEFPIEPNVSVIQWLPLSHLADYEEVGVAKRKSGVSTMMFLRTSDGEPPIWKRRTQTFTTPMSLMAPWSVSTTGHLPRAAVSGDGDPCQQPYCGAQHSC